MKEHNKWPQKYKHLRGPTYFDIYIYIYHILNRTTWLWLDVRSASVSSVFFVQQSACLPSCIAFSCHIFVLTLCLPSSFAVLLNSSLLGRLMTTRPFFNVNVLRFFFFATFSFTTYLAKRGISDKCIVGEIQLLVLSISHKLTSNLQPFWSTDCNYPKKVEVYNWPRVQRLLIRRFFFPALLQLRT